MLANNTGRKVFELAGRYGNVGHIASPGGLRGSLGELPVALDNGAFVCWSKGKEFDEGAFWDHLHGAAGMGLEPLWVVVPDVVGDAEATLRNWSLWARGLRDRFGWPLAFAAQDGMEPRDVPGDADVVFIGGTTAWKLGAIRKFCMVHRRVHVGRVNTGLRLWKCHHAGVESVDGTGFCRGNRRQWADLERFLACVNGERKQHPLFGCL